MRISILSVLLVLRAGAVWSDPTADLDVKMQEESALMIIPYLAKTPVLDGVLSEAEWTGAWTTSIDVETNPTQNPGWDVSEGRTLSKADCSYDLYVMHDGESLYVAMDVNDDVVSTAQAPMPNTPPPPDGGAEDYIYQVWWDDCTEVFIDADRDGINENYSDMSLWAEGIHPHVGPLGHFWVKADNPDKGGVFGTTYENGWWVATSLRPGGYIHEYRLKLSKFDTEDGPGFTPLKPGDSFGFNVLVNDDDEENPPDDSDRREDQVVWWGADIEGYDTFKFAETWPLVKLSSTVGEANVRPLWNNYR